MTTGSSRSSGTGWAARGGSRDLQRRHRQVTGDPLSPVIQLGLLPTMGHAEYVLGAGLHFALATTSYCHYSLPDPALPDLSIGCSRSTWSDFEAHPAPRVGRNPPRAAERASELERRAEEAEREMTKLRSIRYLEPMVGEAMDGWIVSVHPFGFFVRIEETLVEGLVHVSTLDDDYYDFDEEARACRPPVEAGLPAGDRVRVELTEVDGSEGDHLQLRAS